ncbi:MAG TPA: PQQ-dependent sugar dehydrogenase [Pyrinomonadaceae bacterium]|nr:PQQ-dependent sugar dehydrogenase [Pyrinomonadaceae bacterium]
MGSKSDFAASNSQPFTHTVKNSLVKLSSSRAGQALAVAVLLLCCALLPVRAATLPANFSETLYAGGLSAPTAMAFAPDGRLFVCQQDGQLRVIKNGALLAAPFLTVSVDSLGERGLLGVAFHPSFASNGFVYVYYTATTTPRRNRVSRFTANGDVAVAGSEVIILELDDLSSASNHNGGAIHFGPDGKLYIAVGENANPPNAQTLTNLLGKVLRVNPDGTIPSDNPFFNQATGKNRAIWALGLRNPFTFDFQPGTGRMFINDVGETQWEEINDGIAGSNYGWPTTEGPTSNPNFRSPIFAYQHGTGANFGCAITGGAFYNPSTQQFPNIYVGNYFFADLCSGWIRVLDPANNNAVSNFASGINQPVDLKVGPDGSLYYLARGSSAVFRIQYNGPVKISTTTTVTSTDSTSAPGQSVTFHAKVTFASATAAKPTGTVQFKVDGVNLGSPVNLSVDTTAFISTSSLSEGTHTVTAEYSGDNNFAASTGTLEGGLTVAVTKRIEFTQTAFQIREDADGTAQHFPALTVEVRRVGDASAPASVQYLTTGAGGADCSRSNGQASENCDFIAVSGILRFAAGETTKTFTIPIINDGYKEGREFILATLSNPTGAVVTLGSIATIAIEDDPADDTPTTPTNNPYLNNSFFVRQLYLDFLMREPDAAGFADWTNVLNNCGPQKGFLGAPPTCDRAHVAHGFFGSPEFTDRGLLIYRMYEVGMGRLLGYAEFMHDMGLLRGFGLSGAEQQQNLDAYLQEFAGKLEFTNRFSDALQPSQASTLILKMEQTVGVTLPNIATTKPGQPTQYARHELINLRANGTLTVVQTLKAFVEQQSVYDASFERGEVTLLYFALLRRHPSFNDLNLVGWKDWVDVFKNGRPSQGIPPRDIQHLLFGFIYSEEYRQRFGAP